MEGSWDGEESPISRIQKAGVSQILCHFSEMVPSGRRRLLPFSKVLRDEEYVEHNQGYGNCGMQSPFSEAGKMIATIFNFVSETIDNNQRRPVGDSPRIGVLVIPDRHIPHNT